MKDSVLEILRQNKNNYTSGEELSRNFGVSRAAIWKIINQLKEEGYTIESKTKRGYRLVDVPEYLYPSEILDGLTTKNFGRNIHYFKELDSTNDYAKKIAREKNFQEGDLVIAEAQLSGRGRFSRVWISPSMKGLYFTLLLQPQIPLEMLTFITMIAANALCKTIEELTHINTSIKWPNDIMINGKKVAGILTEASGEIDEVKYMVVGIGININHDENDFEDIIYKATSLFIETGSKVNRKILLQNFLKIFEQDYERFVSDFNKAEIVQEYKSKSMLIGKWVEINTFNKKSIKAKVVDINQNGELVAVLENGEEINFISGEVTLSNFY